MKDKTRITLMMGTSASGESVTCCSWETKKSRILQTDGWRKATPSLKKQANAWFDQKIIPWWIINVIWPYQLHTEVDVNAMIFLDNCSAHTLYYEEKAKLPNRIFIFFLQPNVTNTHQPSDMDMIYSIKVGYKVTLLELFLSIFDIEGGYLRAYY